MVNCRFYILNRHEQITKLHVAPCKEPDDVERTATALLSEHVASFAVEVWDRDKRIYRTERSSAGAH